MSGPSRTFFYDRELSYPVSNYTKKSQFVLYDNGAFVLRFTSLAGEGYRGGYTQTNGDLDFQWESSSTGGRWGASGTLKGDLLTIQYNLIMLETDFENAVYALMR